MACSPLLAAAGNLGLHRPLCGPLMVSLLPPGVAGERDNTRRVGLGSAAHHGAFGPRLGVFGLDLGLTVGFAALNSPLLKEGLRNNPRGRGPRGKNGNTAMAADRAQNLQDTFLNHVRKNKMPLTIFLVNGVKLQGVVTWFDNFCVLLRRDGHSQLVYKHAISTIMPGTRSSCSKAPRKRRPGKRSDWSRAARQTR